MIKLRLLGGFDVEAHAGVPLLVPTRKAKALLAYLSLSPAAVHRRDALAPLLWADLDANAARNALRQTIFVLRKALAPTGPSPLRATDEGVVLTPGVIDNDVAAFELAVQRATPAALEHAEALYRGDFLAGLTANAAPFEDWLMRERERLRELAMEAFGRLLAHRQETGATAAAVLTALRLLDLDPTQEAVHRSLMRLYVREGRRDAALRQYQECLHVLQRELSAEPEPATRELYQEILRQRPGRTTTPTVVGLSETSMVGRAAEVVRLREELTRAWAGASRLMAVVGEAGIGKSRLLADLATEVNRRGGKILLGRAYENERMAPLAPWLGALRDAGVLGDRATLEDVDSRWHVVLSRLFPELGTSGPLADTPATDHLQIFEALAHLLRRLAIAQPLVVLLEDCHWADDLTLRFLGFFTRRIHGAPILLAISVRDDELADRTLLDAILGELAREDRLCHIDLDRLSRADTLALVEQLVASEHADAVKDTRGQHVWLASHGNPFIIVETMRSISEGDTAASPASLALPAKVRDGIARRIERLTPGAREVAELASAIGREFEFGLLHAAAGLDAGMVAEALDELVRRRVLQTIADRLDFAHDRIREVAYDRLNEDRRRTLHVAVASAIERLHAGRFEPHYTALAFHYRAGKVWPRAVEYSRLAGVQAMERGAYHESAASFDQAIAALEQRGDDPAAAREALDLRLHLRNALLPIGDQPRMLANLRAAEGLAERLGDRARLGWILSYAALERWRIGEAEPAIELANRVLDIGQELDQVGLRVIARVRLGQAHHSLGRYGPAIAALRDTVSELGDDRGRERYGLSAPTPPGVIPRVWLAWCLAECGDFSEARRHAEVALALAEAVDQPYPLAAACFGLGLVGVRQGDLAGAIDILERGIVTCRRGEIPVFLSWTAALLSVARATAGRSDPDATTTAEIESSEAAAQAFPLLWLGEAHLLAGHIEEAEAYAERARVLAAGRCDRPHEAYAVHLQAEIATRRNHVDAEKLYRSARSMAHELGMQPLQARCDAALDRRQFDGAGDVTAPASAPR